MAGRGSIFMRHGSHMALPKLLHSLADKGIGGRQGAGPATPVQPGEQPWRL